MAGVPRAEWKPELELHHAMLWGSTLEQMIAAGQAGGYGSLVLRPYQLDVARAAGRSKADIRAMLGDAGLTVHYIDGFPAGLPGSGSIEAKLKGSDVTEAQVVDALEVLDAKYVNVPHYLGKRLPQAVLRDALAGLCERLGREGRGVLVEFQPESGVASWLEAIDLARETGCSNIATTLDTVQLAHAGGSPEQLTADTAPWLGAIQVADKRGPIHFGRIPEAERFSRVQPGEGDLPLAELLRRVRQFRPGLAIGVEVFSKALMALSPDEAARQTADTTRALIASL